MAIDIRGGMRRALDIRRFLPGLGDVLRPFPSPQQADLVNAGITADILSWAVGLIPYVGHPLGAFINDNIMADVLMRLSPQEQAEFREQTRVYPNGIALLRTFQRTRTIARRAP